MKKQDKAKLESLFLLAEQYESKGQLSEAFKCLLKAATGGHVSSQLNLGNFYANGSGTSKDLAAAAKWYKKAYMNGRSGGALNLAIDRQSQGKLRSAEFWLRKAIELKNGAAYIRLAELYIGRKGCEKEAEALLRKALFLKKSDYISSEEKKLASNLIKSLKNKV